MNKQTIDHKRHLIDVINDLTDNNIRILQYVADNQKRALARDSKSHSGWYACEYCLGKGVKVEIIGNSKARKQIIAQKKLIEQKIREIKNSRNTVTSNSNLKNLLLLKKQLQKSISTLNKKSNILWPYSTMHSEPRTRESVLDIVAKIENGEELSVDESKGIKGRSPFLHVPHFHYVFDLPAEYLHLSCLGVIKRLTLLTFNIGERRSRVTKRKLSCPDDFNKLMANTKVTKEFSRRARKLDVAVFKGQEYRNLSIFFFPLVLECIEVGAKERNLWLNITFMLRSCLIPDAEFTAVNQNVIKECCQNFYQIFERLFGKTNCSYNLHVFCCHLMDIRLLGPLTETSAFPFESFYGEVRRSFVPGTISPLKQIMKNVLLKRAIRKHVCEPSIFISNYDTSLECNKLVYCFVESEYLIYQIKEINGDIATCNKLGQYPVSFPETPNINWSSVGVFRRGGMCSDTTEIQTSDIDGKALNVGKYLITCPVNVLNDK